MASILTMNRLNRSSLDTMVWSVNVAERMWRSTTLKGKRQAALLGIRVSHRYVEPHLENVTHRSNALNKVQHKFRPIIAPWENIKQNPWNSMIAKSERSHYVHRQADQNCPVKSYDFCWFLCRFFGRPRMYESPFAALDVAKLLEWFEVPSHTDWHSLSHSFWTSPARQPQLKARWWFQICFIFTPKLGKDSHVDSHFSDGLKPPTRKWSCKKINTAFMTWLPGTIYAFVCRYANDRPHVCFRWDWWG